MIKSFKDREAEKVFRRQVWRELPQEIQRAALRRLIYLHAAARRLAVGHLRRLLLPGGLLCCAPVEARILGESGFANVTGDHSCVFTRSDELPGVATETAVALPSGPGAAPKRVGKSSSENLKGDLRSAVAAGSETRAERRSAGSENRAERGEETVRTAEKAAESDLLEAARRAADDGFLDEAASLCQQVLARNPTNVEACYLYGVICQSRGAASEAQQWFEKALYLHPKHYQALVHLMLLAEQRGDRDGAANYRRRAHRKASTQAE